ncbi:MAG TPA: MFS transporter [Myxococcales bacterium]|nr:MFS transporter [Myxococcales bacterium]
MRAPGIVRIRRGDVPEASRREWIGLGVLAIPCVLYSMDLTVLNLAVPSLIADLRPSSTQLLWIIDIYGFVLAGSLIPMGTLGDRIGRRRLLLLGAAAFGVSSVIAAFATSVAMLIAARAILGVAGATLAPSTLSLIRNMFQNPAQRRVAVGVWVASFSAGTAIGPLVGGALLEHFWWGSVFLVGVPLMLVLLVLGPVLLPEFRDPAPGRVDLISSALSLLGILGIIYGLKRVAAAGSTSAAALSILLGAGAAILFVRRQARLAHPLIDLQVFRRPAFTAALAIYALTSFVTLGVFVFTSQYLQLVLRLSPWHAGLCTVPFAGAFIVGSLFTAPVARRVRPAWVIASGLFLAAAGFTLLAQLRADSSLALFIAGEVVEALGLAPVFTLANDLIIGSAPSGRAGAAAALSETGSELGGALGIAVLGSIGAVAYRHEMAQAGGADLVPAARDALGTALQIAQGLPFPANAALAGAARHAFSSSLRLMCGVAAIVAVGLSIAAALLLEGGATKVATIEGNPLSSLE